METGQNSVKDHSNGFIFDIKRFAIHDGPGIRTTVFFKSCPLNCFWCHNPEGIDHRPSEWIQERTLDGRTFIEQETVGRYMSADEMFRIIERDRVFYRESGGGVTFSGGEPLVQPEFLLEMLRLCQEKGIHTCVDTSGYANEDVFMDVLRNCDLLLLDLKHADEKQHYEGTGVSNKLILNNLEKIKDAITPVWLRLPMIPGYNMDQTSWERMMALLEEVRSDNIKQVHLLPFHQAAAHKYMKCGRENKMSQAKTVSKQELIPYQEQLQSLGWSVFLEG